MTENETKTKNLAEDYKIVLNEAKAMKCSKIGALYNIPLKSMELIVQALEKQIPKKPTYEGDGYAPDSTFVWDEWLCPCCGERYEVDYDDYDYCPNCGQKIDWSVKNEID